MIAVENFLALTLSSVTPILIAAIGAMFAERARVTNIAIDGIMLLSALSAVAVTYASGNPWLGVLAGLLTGVIYAQFLAIAALFLRCNLIISGVALNLLATGLSYLILQNVLDSSGNFSPPGINLIPRVQLDWLSNVPLVGGIFRNQSLLALISIALVLVAIVVSTKTRFGIHVKATGESEEAAAAVGINTTLVRVLALAISGGAAGLAGAYLGISSVGSFNPALTGGLGYIAFAAVVFGGATPGGTVAASFIFAAFYALSIALQGAKLVDYHLLQALPYLATIAALAIDSIRKRRRDRYEPVPTSHVPVIVP